MADFLEVRDERLQRLVPASARIETVARGFQFTEGPIWLRDGSLVFSDIPANTMFRWTEASGVSVFRRPSGYNGIDFPPGAFIGSNGLTLDAAGRVVICEHGNGRVTRLEPDGSLTVLASKYQGKRLNSPNDAVFHSSGALFFTDPPYGFVHQDEDPKKQLDFNGVFRLDGSGDPHLLFRDLRRPNGLAFSPDEKTFYLANSDPARRLWMRFDVTSKLTLDNPSVFADHSHDTETPGNPDGMKVDREGTLYMTGPGGVWVYLPDGACLGRIVFPEIPANLHWGDPDAQTLYVTARTSVYSLRLNVPGIRPTPLGR